FRRSVALRLKRPLCYLERDGVGMSTRTAFRRITRRRILTGLAAGATASLAASRAFAQADDPLQQLIQQNQRGTLSESFDSTSRTIAMPKASLPTLAPA